MYTVVPPGGDPRTDIEKRIAQERLEAIAAGREAVKQAGLPVDALTVALHAVRDGAEPTDPAVAAQIESARGEFMKDGIVRILADRLNRAQIYLSHQRHELEKTTEEYDRRMADPYGRLPRERGGAA